MSTIPSGAVKFSDLQTALGGTNPISMSEYFADSTSGYSTGVSGIPNKFSAIGMSVFRGKSKNTGPLYTFGSHTFTNAGATGRNGPTLAQCTSAYSSASWASNTSYFNVSTQGIQIWTVPYTAVFDITVAGAASGWNYNGTGNGAILTIKNVTLSKDTKLYIVVGQRGVESGGGGGTWVFLNTVYETSALFVAGGGGGSGYNAYNGPGNALPTGANASTNTSAGNGAPTSYAGGTGGSGGSAGGGANGQNGNGSAGGSGNGGDTSSNNQINVGGGGGGGASGINGNSTFVGGTGGVDGGFGGGGSGSVSGWGGGGGGGGGYSGGGGGAGGASYNEGGGRGGGGGSYTLTGVGTLSSSSSTNTGHGYVSIVSTTKIYLFADDSSPVVNALKTNLETVAAAIGQNITVITGAAQGNAGTLLNYDSTVDVVVYWNNNASPTGRGTQLQTYIDNGKAVVMLVYAHTNWSNPINVGFNTTYQITTSGSYSVGLSSTYSQSNPTNHPILTGIYDISTNGYNQSFTSVNSATCIGNGPGGGLVMYKDYTSTRRVDLNVYPNSSDGTNNSTTRLILNGCLWASRRI